MTKYYKTTITYEVLSVHEPVQFETLTDLHYECTEGHCSGMFVSTDIQTLTEEEVRAALIAQGSEPEFLIEGGA